MPYGLEIMNRALTSGHTIVFYFTIQDTAVILMTNLLNKMVSVLVVLILLTLFYLIIFSKSGLRDWLNLRGEEQKILTENRAVKQENSAIAEKIFRLKHDPEYIEYTARHEFGMAAPGELVFRFKKQSGKGKK